MLLAKSQMTRFVNASGDLVTYAADKTGRFRELFPVLGGEPDEEVMGEIADWIWDGHTSVIPEFVAQNPGGLPQEDLREVARWRDDGLESDFPVVMDQGNTVFLTEDYGIVVSGLTQEPAALLNRVPAYVHAVLVPWEDRIVYVQTLSEYSVAMGDGMRKAMADELDRVRREGRLLSSADDFVAALPAIRDAMAKGKEKAAASADFQANGPSQDYLDGLVGMPAGYHRGRLAGLPWEERQEIADKHLRRNLLSGLVPAVAGDHALKGPEVHDLAGLLSKRKKDDLREVADVLDMDGTSKLRKAELVDALVEELDVQLPIYLDSVLSEAEAVTLRAIRDALAAGGRAVLDPEVGCFALVVSQPWDVVVSYFVEGSDVVAVLPDEFLDELREYDWDALVEDAEVDIEDQRAEVTEGRHQSAVEFADKLVWLRGIVTLRTAAREYRAYMKSNYPDASRDTSEGGIQDAIVSAWERDPMTHDYELLSTRQDDYLVYRDLADSNWRDLTGTEARTSLGYAQGYPGASLGDFLRDIMAHQQAFPPRPVPPEMARVDAYLDWAIEQPPVRRLARYLDAHVPDGEDDVQYVEDVLKNVVEVSHGSLDFTKFIQVLGDHGVYADEDGLRAVTWLVMQVVNGLPCWDDNGWSPEEARRMSRMKVVEGGRRERKPRPRKKGRRR